MLMIDSISNVTLSNGVVRIEVSSVNADGQSRPAGEIGIPANQLANVVNGLANAAQQLNERIGQQQQAQQEESEGQNA
jgi:hypothetical protein